MSVLRICKHGYYKVVLLKLEDPDTKLVHYNIECFMGHDLITKFTEQDEVTAHKRFEEARRDYVQSVNEALQERGEGPLRGSQETAE